MIGTSLSDCIADILAGRVSEEEVEEIYTGTAYETADDWDSGIAHYQHIYWRNNPKAPALIARLRRDGKILQPRLDRGMYPVIACTGHWVDSFNDIEWEDDAYRRD